MSEFSIIIQRLNAIDARLDNLVNTNKKSDLVSLSDTALALNAKYSTIYKRFRLANLEPEVEYFKIKNKVFLTYQAISKIKTFRDLI